MRLLSGRGRKNLRGVWLLAVGIGTTWGMLHAQYHFGQNKIQYHRFDWHILKTAHFDIYYYPEMETLAEIGAHEAERCYEELQDLFNHTLLHRIPLIFYSSHAHFQETNTYPYLIPESLGGFFEFIKGRVVIPADGSTARFRQTIRHELVHVFQRSKALEVSRAHAPTPSAQLPLWFVEGLAEYLSEGWSSEAEMILRDGVLNQTLVPLPQLDYLGGGYLIYKQGQAVLQYLSETYGEELPFCLIENLWKAPTFSKVLEITIGKDLKALDEACSYHLARRIYPLMAVCESPRMVSLRITDEGFNTQPAFFRQDTSAFVVFIANRDGYSSVYLTRLDSTRKTSPERLIRGEKSPEWESFHLMNNRIDVTPDGLLALTVKSGPRDALVLYDIPSRRVIRRFQFPGLVSLYSPSWSPDGQMLAFSGLDMSGKRDVYLFRPEDERLIRLTEDDYDDIDPDWSPDGRLLVFSSDRTVYGEKGYYNLFFLEIGTGEIQYLTRVQAHDRQPAWSPDGRWIAFSSDRDGVPNLWICPVDLPQGNGKSETGSLRQITRFATGAFTPSWADSLLLFTAFEGFGFQIRCLMDTPKRLAKAESHPPDDPPPHRAGPWAHERVEGKGQVEKIRYSRKFSLDFAQSQVIQDPIYGTSGGGQLAVSDLLGNEIYYVLLYNNARTRSEFWDGFNFAATRVDMTHRVNYAFGLYRLSGLYFNEYEGFFRERRMGGYGNVAYPLNRFERIETSLNIRDSRKTRYSLLTDRKAFLVSNFFSYTHDNALWGPTGPIDGSRYKITLGNTVDIRHSQVNFTTCIVDWRRYFRVGLRMCHAVRIWGAFNRGREPLPFVMGGSWDLRGYRLWSLWGPQLFLVSNEFRFPFIDRFYLKFPFGGVGFSAIRGALFLDAGNVWEGTWPNGMKGSFGFGIRCSLGGLLALRLDIGRRTDFRSVSSSTFRQFFFGWDF